MERKTRLMEFSAQQAKYHRYGRVGYFESVSNLLLHETKTKINEISGISNIASQLTFYIPLIFFPLA